MNTINNEKKNTPLSLTEEMLEEEHKNVLNDKGYGSDYTLIDSILNRFPTNTDSDIVAMKIALIDMTNSTNLSRHRKSLYLSWLILLSIYLILMKEYNKGILLLCL